MKKKEMEGYSFFIFLIVSSLLERHFKQPQMKEAEDLHERFCNLSVVTSIRCLTFDKVAGWCLRLLCEPSDFFFKILLSLKNLDIDI